MILIGKVKSNSFYNDDEKSDEGFDERRYGDRRNRVYKKSPLYKHIAVYIYILNWSIFKRIRIRREKEVPLDIRLRIVKKTLKGIDEEVWFWFNLELIVFGYVNRFINIK